MLSVRNKQLRNLIMKADSTLEAYAGCAYTLLFYKIRGNPWENVLKTTALHQPSSTVSFLKAKQLSCSFSNTCFPFNLMCLFEGLLVFCGDRRHRNICFFGLIGWLRFSELSAWQLLQVLSSNGIKFLKLKFYHIKPKLWAHPNGTS